jgi:hypothetical protein
MHQKIRYRYSLFRHVVTNETRWRKQWRRRCARRYRNDVQADYFVENTNKTVKKSLKPGYARSRFEVERKAVIGVRVIRPYTWRSFRRDLLRPYGTMTTRVRNVRNWRRHTLHPTGRSESHKSKSFAERVVGRRTREHCTETMRYAPNPGPRWVEDDHSDSESDDDDNGRMEKLHTMMESAQKPQKCIMVAVVNAHRKRRRMRYRMR